MTREVSFGDTDDVILGPRIQNISVDNRGRVFIADVKQNTIHVYNSDGTYLQDIGREGRGPGEFQRIQDFKINNAHIYILDSRLSRISVFMLNTFHLEATYNLSFGKQQNEKPSWLSKAQKKGLFYRPSNIYVRRDGSYLVLFSDNSVARSNNINGRTFEASKFNPNKNKYTANNLLSFRWTGQVLIHKDNGGMIIMFGVPYKRSSKFDFNNGSFVLGWTDEMLFKFFDQDGAYQHAFYYPYSNIPLHMEDVFAYYEHAGNKVTQAIRNDDLPDTWPAFDALKMDDENRLWVSTIVDNQKMRQWWVMKSNGQLIAQFNWPRSKPIQVINNDYMYTKEKNNDGLEEIVRYRIEMK